MKQRNMEKSKFHHLVIMKPVLLLLCLGIMLSARSQRVSQPLLDSLKAQDRAIMSKVVQMPEFAEGEDKLMHNIWKKIQMIELDDSIIDHSSTKVILRFIVNEDSTISDIYVYKSIYPKIDKQIVEITRNLGKFNPALDKNMRPIKAVMILPIQLEFRKN